MGFFDKISKGIEAAYSNDGPSEEALASLSPEQRARYDEQMARVAEAEAEVAGNHLRLQRDHAARFAGRPLQGPAGEHLYGPAAYPGADPGQFQDMSAAELMEWQAQQTKAQLAELADLNPFGRRKRRAAAALDEHGQAPPPDPRSPQQIANDEWIARAKARAPYLSPTRTPVVITRIATRGKTQADEVATYLGTSGLAGRPDLVYGVSRVPDRISPNLGGSEKGRVVEWDVVHAANEALPPVAPPTSVWFDGEDRWVARAVGEPSVLDEDLVAAYLVSAGIGPEQTLGIARQLSIKQYSDGDDHSYLWSSVVGVRAFHAPGLGAEVLQQMTAARPLHIGSGPPQGVHVEVLDWKAIGQVVQARIHQPPTVPSPFPYLPGTPQELYQSYLEIVGVHPADSYSVQATIDRSTSLVGRERAGFLSIETNMGAAQPCADGQARRRFAGARQVVLAYRDRPEYAEGRERWAAYQRDVLQATLQNETGVHRPVISPTAEYDDIPRGLKSLAKVANVVDRVSDGISSQPEDVPHRYCWPPIQRT